MELKFLGNGSAFNPSFGSTSAYLQHAENLFVVDCGETTFERLMANVNFQDYREIYIVLTHLHADHVGSLGSMISYCYCVLEKTVTVVYPGKEVIQLLTLLGVNRKFYKYAETMQNGYAMNNENGVIQFLPVSVKHALDMKCFGYIIEWHGEKIYYSGDASDIPQEVLMALKSGDIDRIYQDTTVHLKSKGTHCYIDRLEELIERQYRNRVYCMHLDQEYESIRKKGFQIVSI